MFTENLDAFLDTNAFAIAATLQGGAVVNVIFDQAALDVLGVAGVNPVALAKASAVSAANIGQTLTINGTAYTIRNRQPQDDGALVLLQLSAP